MPLTLTQLERHLFNVADILRANGYNRNIRHYADNAPSPPHDVRAQLEGGACAGFKF